MATTEEESKKNHEEEEEEEVDRLSDLPDGILLHILSFLPGIRSCVQTTLLSKRWNNLWAFLPDLIFDFDTDKSRNTDAGSFNQFVRNVLNRCQNLPLNKFSFKYYQKKDESLITTIIKYAMSHNVQHFSLYLSSASLTSLFPLFNISTSLKTLHLESFSSSDAHLLEGFTLPTLTTLYLRGCHFRAKGELVSMDPFVGLFNLKSLQLYTCFIDSLVNFKITGPQLASLSVTCNLRNKAEVFAPNLRFFSFKCIYPLEFSGLDFPLLEFAVIDYCHEDELFGKSLLNLINMFRRGLYNARSLVVSSRVIEDLIKCLDVLEDQSSPFVRLEALTVECPHHLVSSFEIPDNVIKYFGENITVDKMKW